MKKMTVKFLKPKLCTCKQEKWEEELDDNVTEIGSKISRMVYNDIRELLYKYIGKKEEIKIQCRKETILITRINNA